MESCYFCRNSEIVEAKLQRPIHYDKQTFTFYYCKKCYGYSLLPKLSDSQIAELYSVKYIENHRPDDHSSGLIFWNKFQRLEEFLASYSSTAESILFDYGCGADPETFRIANRLGLVPLGMEYSADIREEVSTKTGVKMYSRDDFFESELRFDKIFLGDVIEHLINPETELIQLKSKLNPQGILIAQGPLQGARTVTHLIVRTFALFSQSKVSSYPPYHVSLAHKISMQRILQLAGYENIEIECTEVDWPAPNYKEFFGKPSLRGLILLLAKSTDKLLARTIKSYGSRYFLVAQIPTNGNLIHK